MITEPGELEATVRQLCGACELTDVAFCASLPLSEAQYLLSIIGQQQLDARQTIFREGDAARYLFSVSSGMVKLYKLLPDGRRQITAFLLPGDFFGMAELNDAYVYTAETITSSLLCRFPKNKLEAMLQGMPNLGRRIMNRIRSDMSRTQEQMLVLGRKTAREKIASFMISLYDRLMLRQQEDSSTIQVPMNRSDIADYLGLTIETVSRTLTQLKREGIIDLPNTTHIVLLQVESLRTLADGN